MNVLVKLLVIIIVSALGGQLNAQTNFEKGMAKAFELWQSDSMDAAENLFERIASAEPNKWLPNYYVAQINSLKSWNENDAAVLKTQLEKAQEHLDIARTKTKTNAELLIMQAQIYTNWVAFDGMTYGRKYASKISELYKKAFQLSPENPRAVFCKADWEMGSARYFGKDTNLYCKAIVSSIELFDTFKPESEFHPNWGKERALQVAESCNQ